MNAGGLHLGRVVDERKADFGTGDFLVRGVLGGDREPARSRSSDEVEVGTTVQFHLRDAEAAHEDLDRAAARRRPARRGRGGAAVHLQRAGRRGCSASPDHDAGLLADRLGPIPTAGIFAAGELGQVAGRNELHSFTASMLLLARTSADRAGARG